MNVGEDGAEEVILRAFESQREVGNAAMFRLVRGPEKRLPGRRANKEVSGTGRRTGNRKGILKRRCEVVVVQV